MRKNLKLDQNFFSTFFPVSVCSIWSNHRTP